MTTNDAMALEGGLWRGEHAAGPDTQRAYSRDRIDGEANSLVAAANPLLVLIPQIRATQSHPSPQQLRVRLVDEVRHFEMRAQQAGIANETILGARYCLCTALDEAAALTPWGGSGVWSAHSLLVTFHNETWGGEKFFQLLARLTQNPSEHLDLLELLYYCLQLGFEGRYRIADHGRNQLDTLKQRLLLIIRTGRGEYAQPLSRHWRDSPLLSEVRRLPVPLWAFAVIVGAIGLMGYLAMSWSLGEKSDALYSRLSALALPSMQIEQTAKPAAPAVSAPPMFRLREFLAPEIRDGILSVRDEAGRSVIVLRGDGLFGSGSDKVLSRYIPVLSRVADTLNETQGSILVRGYSDNVPIRTVRFPSNWELSQARADAVKTLLQERIADPARVRAEGRGEADPIAPNDTSENRARNRRVEITVLARPAGHVDADRSLGGIER